VEKLSARSEWSRVPVVVFFGTGIGRSDRQRFPGLGKESVPSNASGREQICREAETSVEDSLAS
ncbi:MAG: hypothetical protein AAF357_01275, partial [Verrucomicrobiota bacterium]